LAVDAATAAILPVGAPDDDETPVRQRRDGRFSLVAPFKTGACIDVEHVAIPVSGAIETLAPDLVSIAVGFVQIAKPDGNKATVGQRRQLRLRLPVMDVSRRGIVDDELSADRRAAVVELSPNHVIIRPGADLVGTRPGDGKTTAGKGDDLRLALRTVRRRTDLELITQRVVVGIVNTTEDAVAAAVLTAGVLPDDDIVAVRQVGDRGRFLGVGGDRIDDLFGAKGYGTVGLRSDVDRNRFRRRNAAVAIGQTERDRPTGFGIGQEILIGQVLDQRFGGLRGRVRIEKDRPFALKRTVKGLPLTPSETTVPMTTDPEPSL